MTLLAGDAALWDLVFAEPPARLRLVRSVVRTAGRRVLDVGCATGTLCSALRRHGVAATGIDINPRFIAAARSKDPAGEYHVSDMRSFRLGRRFDALLCLGTTFSYNLTHADIVATLTNFRRHLRPEGTLVIDVLNAIALVGPCPFRPLTRHVFERTGCHATATIRHRLHLAAQILTEQVTWKVTGRRPRRDPEEALRLFFPQELAFYLETAGFGSVRLIDGYGSAGRGFGGRRLIALAERV